MSSRTLDAFLEASPWRSSSDSSRWLRQESRLPVTRQHDPSNDSSCKRAASVQRNSPDAGSSSRSVDRFLILLGERGVS